MSGACLTYGRFWQAWKELDQIGSVRVRNGEAVAVIVVGERCQNQAA